MHQKIHFLIGLGNPGKKYESTRHNAGFMALDAFARELDLAWQENKKCQALIAKHYYPEAMKETGETASCLLAKPQTFMNLSGESVQKILAYHSASPLLSRRDVGDEALTRKVKSEEKNLDDSLTVIHDDLDIEFGQYRISTDARAAGHNGVQNIIDRLGTKNFRRIRIGIKPPADNLIPAEKYVLQNFSEQELKTIAEVISRIKKEALSRLL